MVIPIPFLCWRWGLEGRYLTAEKAVFWDGKSETGESVSVALPSIRFRLNITRKVERW